MNLLRISPAVDDFAQLAFPEAVLQARLPYFLFDGQPKADVWQEATADWVMETAELPRPDVAHIQIGALALSPRATTLLRPVLDDAAELLPLRVEGAGGGSECWHVLNVTRVLDLLDPVKTVYQVRPNGRAGRVLEPVLRRDLPDLHGVFKIAGLPTQIFTIKARDGWQAIFRHHGLSGLIFTDWSGSSA